MTHLIKKWAAAALSLFAAFQLDAQPIIAPVTMEQFLSGDVGPQMNINCDMLLNYHFKAITWQGSSGVNVNVSDDAGGNVDIHIPDARWSDVALFDYNRVAVIYVLNNEVHLDVYTIWGVGSGTLTASLGIPMLVSTSSNPNLRPHIDAILTPNTSSFNHYVISYVEESGGTFTLYTRHGVVASSFLTTPVAVVAQQQPFTADIAGYCDAPSGNYYGVMAIQNMDNQSVDFAEFLLNTDVVTAYNVLYPNIPNPILSEPRIEAMFSYDNLNHWNAISAIADGTLDPWVFNPSGSFDCMAAYPGWHNWMPAVAAGSGYLDYTPFANVNYPVGWYTSDQDCFVTKGVDVYSGMLNPAYPGYYRANVQPIPIFPPFGNVVLAMSSTSDWGADLLTAWYNNAGGVFYKLTSDITAYKPAPTDVTGVQLQDKSYTVYPNPVADQLHIEGIDGVLQYSITDIGGKAIQSGAVGNAGRSSIATANLAKGVYLLKLAGKEGLVRSVKFVKE